MERIASAKRSCGEEKRAQAAPWATRVQLANWMPILSGRLVMPALLAVPGLLIMSGLLGGTAVGAEASESVGGELRFEHSDEIVLRGRDARLQLLVSDVRAGNDPSDVSRDVSYTVIPEDIVTLDGTLVIPNRDGQATVTAQSSDGRTASTTISVHDTGNESLVSFPGKVVPIFTKLGCNGGGCHGKVAGQNGFKLSLLGFGPLEDHERLVRESRGRRISLANPDGSLLLLKAINSSPHGGGQRLEKDSHEYRILRRWIAQGMPYGQGDEPHVVSLDVVPRHRRMQPETRQQLAVVARYSDGTAEDVTRGAIFESNDPDMASVSATGLVELGNVVGDVAVMMRFQGHVSVFRADVPLSRAEGVAAPRFPDVAGNLVDELVVAKLQSLGVAPSSVCDDATFLRRAMLDIAGRLPDVSEIEQFHLDQSPNKRAALIDRLLESDEYADHFAGKWNTILRNQRDGGSLKFANLAFHQWIRDSIRINKPYDQFVREIVTASGSVSNHPPVAWYRQVPDTNQRIEDAAQLFLGQRIQCARCHHHPYEKWSQADYARLSAFFVTVGNKKLADPSEPMFTSRIATASARDPSSGQNLTPAGLDGEPIKVDKFDDPRSAFADWMTAPKNPFFAKAFVNRYWKHFLGRGLVEPEDDLRVTNPPSNPELLDGMSKFFVESGYDTKALIRLIANSRTYQLDSQASAENLGDRRSYSRYYPKRLTAEVLLDAINLVTQAPTQFEGMPSGTRAVALPDTGFSSYFLTVFGRPRSTTACECERSQEANLSQSLHLLNSEEIQGKLALEQGRAARLAADPRPDEAKLVELYQIALGRQPSDEELKATLTYVSTRDERKEAFEDVIWSLINSKEFLFNH